jgi:hypothetical protein
MTAQPIRKDAPPKFVKRFLEVEGTLAAKIARMARKPGRGERQAQQLRARIIALLGSEVSAGALPEWLKLQYPTGRWDWVVLHLAPPLFVALTLDEDVFFGHGPRLVYYGKGKAEYSTRTAEPKKVSIPESKLHEIDNYMGPGAGYGLFGFVWHEPPPRARKAFDALLEHAHSPDEYDPYDARDYGAPAPTAAPPRGPVTMFFGAGRDGASSAPGPRQRPELRWRSEGVRNQGGEQGGSPLVAGGLDERSGRLPGDRG